jgi:hypothetical protein
MPVPAPPRSAMRLRAFTLTLACCCAAAVALLAGQGARASAPTAQPPPSATLQQCVTSVVQAERSATFAGEMTAVPGTTRMAIRIELQEQPPGEVRFHTVIAPGLSMWRGSDAKVKIYKYLKQVTNLSSPAVYRALVRFRWLGEKGRVIKHAQLLTAHCDEPASPLQSGS